MILSKAYDIEVLPNFFSITIVNLNDYLKTFDDACTIDKKGRKNPIPLVQKYTVAEIKEKLNGIKKVSFYITDKDDSQLLPMIGYINQMRPCMKGIIPIRTDMFGYNTSRYDKLMIAGLLMFFDQFNNVKELITKLYELSKRIISTQDNYEAGKNDYLLNTIKNYSIPYTDIDVMTIFALNKVGKGVDKNGNTIYFPKGLKQTSINLQWYELLEYELPPITDKDAFLYNNDFKFKGITPEQLNQVIEKWDRYIIDEWIPDMMHYNLNDVYIVCEMVRLYIDEVRLRYNISKAYEVNVLSSSRSNIADNLFIKFYSDFSGLKPFQWRGKTTERTALSFKKVIFPFIEFKTPILKQTLEEMKKVIIYSIGKDSFMKEVKLGNLIYTIATGGLHSQDIPRELRSKIIFIEGTEVNSDWSNITDDSYIYVHWDIASFYPSIMSIYKVAPAHLNEGVFCKLITWLKETRVTAKHSKEEFIDGIPKDVLAQVLKIVINSIYGKLGFAKGDLCDRLAVLKVTINGQLMILMLCEELELNGIEVVSANTDGIVVKLYKRDKDKFEEIADNWKKLTKLDADSEEYAAYINRDINNYCIKELNGKVSYKGALHPTMYANDLQKGYDMPIVAEAVVNYFLYDTPILETLYNAKNILDFCKTQNVGKQFHVEYVNGVESKEMQRYVRFYVSNFGGTIYKVNNDSKTKNNLCAGNTITILNTLDDKPIHERNINYNYYYKEALKIIDPIKLQISPNQKGDSNKKTKTGKALIKKNSGMYNSLFDDYEET